jgi:hypothetical protein
MEHQPPIPTDLRKQESRARATAMSDALLRSDSARRARVASNDLNYSRGNVTKRTVPFPDEHLSTPTPLRLTDLSRHPLAPRDARGRP